MRFTHSGMAELNTRTTLYSTILTSWLLPIVERFFDNKLRNSVDPFNLGAFNRRKRNENCKTAWDIRFLA